MKVYAETPENTIISKSAREWSNYFYLRLPKIYRDFDEGTNFQLERYLDSLIVAGYEPLLRETYNVEDLIDPSSCPEEFLPFLCETFGIRYFEDIPSIYQRRFLNILTSLYKLKGTRAVIEYLARELSGLTVEIELIADEYIIRLNAFEEDDLKLVIEQDVISRYVEMFIPVNVTAKLVTSFTFFEEVGILVTDNDMGFNIVDEMTREDLGYEKSAEIFDSSSRMNEENPIDTLTEVVNDEEVIGVASFKSSITNIAVIGVTLHTNIINEIDTITDGSNVTVRIY